MIAPGKAARLALADDQAKLDEEEPLNLKMQVMEPQCEEERTMPTLDVPDLDVEHIGVGVERVDEQRARVHEEEQHREQAEDAARRTARGPTCNCIGRAGTRR